jgi:hypothetical protein
MGLFDSVARGIGLESDPTYTGAPVDPDAYGYQGKTGDLGLFSDRQTDALGRTAQGLDLGQANADYANAQADRTALQGLAGEYASVVNGTAGPSLAELQMRQGLQQAQQNAAQQAASARGPGALAAGRTAVLGGALAGQQEAANAAALRAQEVAQARAAQAALYGGMASQDAANRAQSFAQAQQPVSNSFAQQALNNGLAGTYLQGELGTAAGLTQGTQAGANAANAAAQHAADVNYQSQRAQDARLGSFVGGALNAAAGAATGGIAGGLMGGSGAGAGAPAPEDPYGTNPYR